MKQTSSKPIIAKKEQQKNNTASSERKQPRLRILSNVKAGFEDGGACC